MINQANDTTRAEKLQTEIDDTESRISHFQFLIQKVENIIEDNNDLDIITDFSNLKEKYESEINFLEDIKENDEKVLEDLK